MRRAPPTPQIKITIGNVVGTSNSLPKTYQQKVSVIKDRGRDRHPVASQQRQIESNSDRPAISGHLSWILPGNSGLASKSIVSGSDPKVPSLS